MDNKHHRTGRTTRLLKQAISTASQGLTAVFVTHNHAMRRHVMQMALEMVDGAFGVRSQPYRIELGAGVVYFEVARSLRPGLGVDVIIYDHMARGIM